MSKKNRDWHKNWRKLPNGRLWHDSGLQVEYDEIVGWKTCSDTIDAFQQFELARGVDLVDIQARLMRLVKEAAKWEDRG